MGVVGIIGAGPAGMIAALQASGKATDVQIFDANPKLGRKLLATGSGRCNISNLNIAANKYFCDDQETLRKIFALLDVQSLRELLSSYAVPTYTTPDGWVYPLSNAAANVVQILASQLHVHNVEIQLQTLITDIQVNAEGFLLMTADPHRHFRVEKLVIAAGSPAHPQLGARFTLQHALHNMGHSFNAFQPALAPVITAGGLLHKLQGVRLDMQIALLENGKEIAQTIGNVIITNWGLNGPGVMDLSHLISLRPKQQFTLKLNMIPAQEILLKGLFSEHAGANIPVLDLLMSFLHRKVAVFALRNCGLAVSSPVSQVGEEVIEKIIHFLKNISVPVKGVRGFKEAQAAVGGVPLKEIDGITMESRRTRGLYFAGEIVNVLGPCGGFNLHWAFVSGILAGRNAALNN